MEVVHLHPNNQVQVNHQRVLSDKYELNHAKKVSNFSNFSAISKIEHHSVLSN